ncbi:TPA: VOC family protein [Yersinia enterocolitica]
MLGHIHHISITCRNIHETLTFYNILGFREIKTYCDDICIISHLSDSTGFVIEIFHYIKSRRCNENRIFSTEIQGITHFAFVVNNIDKVIEDLKTKGVECGNLITARIDTYRYFFAYDPDGNAIEFIEEIK